MPYYMGSVRLPVRSCRKPSMRNHRGRTWDEGRVKIDGVATAVWLDTSWGEFFYWLGPNGWLKLRMQGSTYDVNPTNPASRTPELTTVKA